MANKTDITPLGVRFLGMQSGRTDQIAKVETTIDLGPLAQRIEAIASELSVLEYLLRKLIIDSVPWYKKLWFKIIGRGQK